MQQYQFDALEQRSWEVAPPFGAAGAWHHLAFPPVGYVG